MLVREIILKYTDELKNISTTPRLDVEILIMNILGYKNKIDLMMNYDKSLNEKQFNKFLELFCKRKKSMPIAYIINKKEFMGIDFYVDENVLIPRPDTEIIVEDLIELAINRTKNTSKNIAILDMCVGSGAIIISTANILKEKLSEKDYARISFYGVDISEAALTVANLNKCKLNLENINLIHSDLFSDDFINTLNGTLDIIVSNPPYIEDKVINTLSSDVKDYEPILALSGGEDGMFFYNKIIEESSSFLCENGILIFESGYDQSEKIKNKMSECGFSNIYTKKDLQGFDRLVCGKKL